LYTSRPIQDCDRKAIDCWEETQKFATLLSLSSQGLHQTHIRLDESWCDREHTAACAHYPDGQRNGRTNFGFRFSLRWSANSISRQQL
jgi:hypothetical protein